MPLHLTHSALADLERQEGAQTHRQQAALPCELQGEAQLLPNPETLQAMPKAKGHPCSQWQGSGTRTWCWQASVRSWWEIRTWAGALLKAVCDFLPKCSQRWNLLHKALEIMILTQHFLLWYLSPGTFYCFMRWNTRLHWEVKYGLKGLTTEVFTVLGAKVCSSPHTILVLSLLLPLIHLFLQEFGLSKESGICFLSEGNAWVIKKIIFVTCFVQAGYLTCWYFGDMVWTTISSVFSDLYFM